MLRTMIYQSFISVSSLCVSKVRTFLHDSDKTPKTGWPEKGEIRFEDVSLQYNPNDAPVLKNLNFCIKANEKVIKDQIVAFSEVVLMIHFRWF